MVYLDGAICFLGLRRLNAPWHGFLSPIRGRYGLACGYGLTHQTANNEGFLTEPPPEAALHNLVRRRRSIAEVCSRTPSGTGSGGDGGVDTAAEHGRCSSVSGSTTGADIAGGSLSTAVLERGLVREQWRSWRSLERPSDEWKSWPVGDEVGRRATPVSSLAPRRRSTHHT